MPWVRFDDQYPIHRKVAGLSDAAFRLHTSAIFWCARNLTDGYVPEEDLDGVSARVRTPQRFAAECVRKGSWHPPGDVCTSEQCPMCPSSKSPVDNPAGWVIHDYFAYQPSRKEVLRDREASARRQKKWREARYPQALSTARTASDQRNPHIHREKPESNASSNAVTNAVSASAPPRPEGKRGRASPGRARANGATRRSAADRTAAEAIAAALNPDDTAGRHARGEHHDHPNPAA